MRYLLAVPPTAGSSISRSGWSPGSRVGALSRAFPFPVARCGWARRSQLRGQLRNWKPGLGPSSPHSHLIPRRVSRRRGTRANPLWGKALARASGFARLSAGCAAPLPLPLPLLRTASFVGKARIAAAEPDREAAPPAAHARDIDGEDQKPERHHPEAEDRQEAEQPEEDENARRSRSAAGASAEAAAGSCRAARNRRDRVFSIIPMNLCRTALLFRDTGEPALLASPGQKRPRSQARDNGRPGKDLGMAEHENSRLCATFRCRPSAVRARGAAPCIGPPVSPICRALILGSSVGRAFDC